MTPGVSLMRIETLFDIRRAGLNIDNYDKIFINLSSLLNSMYYLEMVDELQDREKYKEYTNDLKTIFKSKFLDLYRIDKIYYFYVHTKPSFVKKYYPEWDKVINKCKFEDSTFKEVTNFILNQVLQLSKKMKNVKFVNCHEIETSLFPYYFSLHNDTEKSLIISRDELEFLNLGKFQMYDGITHFKSGVDHYSNKIPKIHHGFFPYVIYLKGIKKHNFKGTKGYGLKSALKYVALNVKNLNNDLLFKPKDFTIFNFQKLYSENKERIDEVFRDHV